MNKSKLGSIFLKEIDQYERSVVGGMTARIFIMVLGVGAVVMIGVLPTVFWSIPDLYMYMVVVLGTPPFIVYGLKLDGIVKERLLFILTIQERSYQTDDDFTAFGNKEVTYGNSAFSQAKDVHEWQR